jgi:hypothetical protein
VWSLRADQQSGVRNVKVGIRVTIAIQARSNNPASTTHHQYT